MVRFLHAADIHLDSPLLGLGRHEGAPIERLRTATRDAFRNLIDLAIASQVDLLLIAGDLHDGDWKDYNSGLFLVHEFARLREATGCRVFLIAGNHDAENRMTRSLPFPENVHVFGSEAATSVVLDDLGVAIHGQSFATPKTTENLAVGYPAAIPGLYNIGLLHTCGQGVEGHEPYAPCSPGDLKRPGYDYWALGHIHTRQFLSETDPLAVFSGNLQGRHARETGPKGCLLVAVDQQNQADIEFRELDVFRWIEMSVALDDCEDFDAVRSCCADRLSEQLADCELPMAVRLHLTGRTRLDSELRADRERLINDLRAVGITLSPDRIWIERVKLETTPVNEDTSFPIDDGPLEELRAVLIEAGSDPDLMTELLAGLRDFESALPADLLPQRLTLDAETLDEAHRFLVAKLTADGT